MRKSVAHIYELLKEVPDPEIPVISILDLGVVREVELNKDDSVEVKITPTYSGCPAMTVFEDDLVKKLEEHGYGPVKVHLIYEPAWTTDWISEEARAQLKAFGIAPPQGSADKNDIFEEKKHIQCPRCNGQNTFLESQFGSTACKALYKCKDCLEPFEYFKCL